MSKKSRAPRVLVIAAAAVLAVALVGFTFGKPLVIQLLGGGQYTSYRDSDGSGFVCMGAGFETDPAQVRNGRVYFVLDGSGLDITEYCTRSTYYQYERMNDDGSRDVVLVGGDPDDLGWAEFVWAPDGTRGSSATYHGDEQPPWLAAGEAALK